jgi:metal-responsive CopG/Arc/MetJ family transcriptional regulator
MTKSKIAITLDSETLERLDGLVADKVFPNRSRAIQDALDDRLERLDKGRLARECAKLDPTYEKSLAEEGLAADVSEWPEY